MRSLLQCTRWPTRNTTIVPHSNWTQRMSSMYTLIAIWCLAFVKPSVASMCKQLGALVMLSHSTTCLHSLNLISQGPSPRLKERRPREADTLNREETDKDIRPPIPSDRSWARKPSSHLNLIPTPDPRLPTRPRHGSLRTRERKLADHWNVTS